MLPVLQAEESMRLTTAIAVGTGSLKKEESQRIMREWQRHSGGQGRGRRQITMEQRMHMVEAMGIKAIMHPPVESKD